MLARQEALPGFCGFISGCWLCDFLLLLLSIRDTIETRLLFFN
jgi:hypothetical protein